MKACGAKKKSGAGVCLQPARPNGRCRFHGGMSPAPGPTNPNWKHGLYSKAIPARLRDRIAAADSDPTILSHRRDLALLDGRLEELLERLTEGGSMAAWRSLEAAVTELVTARDAKDTERVAGALNRIVPLVRAGAGEERAWREAVDVIRERRKQAAAEHKRTLELSQAIRPDELGAIIMRIAQVVRREVSDEATRQRIGMELERISNAPDVLN